MSDILHVWIDDETEARLLDIMKREGKGPGELAESAVAEAALQYYRYLPLQQDPGKQLKNRD